MSEDETKSKCFNRSQLIANYCQAFQAIVVCLAIIVGGFVSYFILKKPLRAKREIASLREVSVLSVDVQSSEIEKVGEMILVVANIQVANIGNRSEIVKQSGTQLRVARAEVNLDGGTTFHDLQTIPLVEPVPKGEANEEDEEEVWLEIMPKEVVVFPFSFIVPEPGLYHLTFMSYTSKEEAHLTGEEPKEKYEYTWFAWRYLIVGKNNIVVFEQSPESLDPAVILE